MVLNIILKKIEIVDGVPYIERFESENIEMTHRRAERIGRTLNEEIDEKTVADVLSVEISWMMNGVRKQ